MKSIVVTRYGGPDVLELHEVPMPEPAEDQVLVKVKAAGVNYADLMQRMGRYPGGPKPPFGAGFEIAGVVEKVGTKVTHWKPGDAVMGFCSGAFSEYAVANGGVLLSKPESLSFRQAAAVPCQYLTAYHALLTLGRLESGQTVLIQAAAGGLGTMLVQVSRNVGATVIGTCSTSEKCALLREIGCHHPINYVTHDFEDEVRQITGQKGCDLVIESVGGRVFSKSLRCLKTRGHLVTLGLASGELRSVDTLTLLVNNLTVSGFHLFAYASDEPAMANAMRDFNAWLEVGKMMFIIKHVFPIEKAGEAQRLIAERKTSGKVVLDLEL